MGILMLNGNNYTGGIQQVYGSSSGNIATFDDGGDNKPLKSLKVAINPVQASGTPTPDNPLPISGWTGAEIHRADGATPHIIDDVYNITWSEAGKVYGGTITVYPDGSGEIDITNASIDDMSSLNWVYDTSDTPYFYAPITGKKVGNNILCEIFKLDTRSVADMDNNSIKGHGGNNTIIVKATDYTSITAFENLVEDKKVIYELATPQHIDFPAGTFPTIKTLLGNNNIWSNTGEILECVYQRDLNIVINQFDERITALEQALNSGGTRSLSLSKSAVNEEETNEEITEEPKEEEQNEDKR